MSFIFTPIVRTDRPMKATKRRADITAETPSSVGEAISWAVSTAVDSKVTTSSGAARILPGLVLVREIAWKMVGFLEGITWREADGMADLREKEGCECEWKPEKGGDEDANVWARAMPHLLPACHHSPTFSFGQASVAVWHSHAQLRLKLKVLPSKYPTIIFFVLGRTEVLLNETWVLSVFYPNLSRPKPCVRMSVRAVNRKNTDESLMRVEGLMFYVFISWIYVFISKNN